MASNGRRANGEGCFIELPDGKFMLRKQIGLKSNGRPYVITVTCRSKKECKAKMKKKEQRLLLEQNRLTNIGVRTLNDLCYEHLNEHLSQKGKIKYSSADRRECTIRNQIEKYDIGKIQCTAVTPEDIRKHIEGFISEDRLSVSSIVKCLDVINSAYKWAILREALSYNPCKPVYDELKSRLDKLEVIESDEETVIVLSKEEEEALRKEANKLNSKGKLLYPIGPYAMLQLSTGLRVGEMCALRWKDYSRKYRTLDISTTRGVITNRDKSIKAKTVIYEGPVKNYQSRVISLSNEAVSYLELIYSISEHTNSNDYILLNERNHPSLPDKVGKNYNNLYKGAQLVGISGTHVLRRTYATDRFDEGASIKSIAGYIGDLESTVSKYYIAVRKKMKQGDKYRNVVPLPSKAESNE